jgi:tRNA 2-(methylsulfanyl)-N6-isopentenyladenosine37 hydroxylase
MLDLRVKTPPEWLDAVFGDFDAFLLDHANCERKASSTGMSFVARYPDRKELLEPMIEFAKEELEHFHIMYRICAQRGLTLADDYKDPYVNALRTQIRAGGDIHFLDRLLVSGVVEARGCERLYMVAEALKERDPALHEAYMELARAESRHHAFFFRMARLYFTEAEVKVRGGHMLDFEAELVQRLPHRAAVH